MKITFVLICFTLNLEEIIWGGEYELLVLNNSPKVKSDTMKLTRSFLQGINKNNDHKIEIIDVIKKRINPCLSCFKC